MEKLVITVTTDCTGSYPRNPHLIPCDDAKGVAQEYVRALDAGATIVHTHGAYTTIRSSRPMVASCPFPSWTAGV